MTGKKTKHKKILLKEFGHFLLLYDTIHPDRPIPADNLMNFGFCVAVKYFKTRYTFFGVVVKNFYSTLNFFFIFSSVDELVHYCLFFL
jgi:hypothetical protein